MRIFGADFGADFSTGCADFGCGFLADFLQKAPNRRTVHFPKNPHKIHTQNPAAMPDPKGRFGRRLSAGRHAKGSEASFWVGALGLNKVAGLGCSSVPVLCLYYILCFKFCDSANETSQTAKRFEKIDLRDENPFRDFFLASFLAKGTVTIFSSSCEYCGVWMYHRDGLLVSRNMAPPPVAEKNVT